MFNEITVCVNDVDRQESALRTACLYAENNSARVVMVYIKPDITSLSTQQGGASNAEIQAAIESIEHRQDTIRDICSAIYKDFKVSTVWRSLDESIKPMSQISCSDVIFANQPRLEDWGSLSESLIYQLIVQTKRPVIMIPREWQPGNFGSNVIIGWNHSPEAMRAISDALPLLESSDRVMVIDILGGRMQPNEYHGLNYLREYLSQKKLPQELVIEDADQPNDIPNVFDRYLNGGGFDLAVTGAFGHTRGGEIILGGVSDHLILHSPIPVFFSH